MSRIAPVCLLLLALHVPSTAAAEDRQAELADGEIFVSKIPVADADYPKVRVEGVIDAPPSLVWALIEDCDLSQEINERVMDSHVVRRESTGVVCSEKVDMPWPIRNLTTVSLWKFNPGPPVWKKTWTLVEGDFDYANGMWRLEPFGDGGKQTRAVYENHFKPQISVPDWLTRAFLKVGLPGLIEDLRKAAAKRNK